MVRWRRPRPWWLRRAVPRAQVKELRIGYQPSPIQDASIAMFEAWGAKNGVKIVKVPNSYGVYVEKMTASLTSNSDQYDVIWHNDDWGQTWAHLLEPTDDVAGQQVCREVGHGQDRVRQCAGPEHRRADGPDLQRVLLPLRPRQAGGSAEDAGRARHREQEAAGRRQGQVRLCRRHVDEQQLVQLVLVDVGQQLRRADAALRARQQEARAQPAGSRA